MAGLQLKLAVAAVAVTASVLFVVYGDVNALVSFVRLHGPTMLVIAQMLGLFYCGATHNYRLGAVLTVTILTTVLWGW